MRKSDTYEPVYFYDWVDEKKWGVGNICGVPHVFVASNNNMEFFVSPISEEYVTMAIEHENMIGRYLAWVVKQESRLEAMNLSTDDNGELRPYITEDRNRGCEINSALIKLIPLALESNIKATAEFQRRSDNNWPQEYDSIGPIQARWSAL